MLHVAAAQILFLDIPDSAAVDLAVTHAKSDPRTARFSGLVNGVLRGIARDKGDALPAELDRQDDAPEWFRDRLAAAYGAGKAQAILAAHRVEAPVDFTVKSDPERWARAFGGIVLPTGSVRVERLAARCRRTAGLRRRRNGGFRTPPRACPQDCSAMSPASASPTSARHPAARRHSWRWPAPR